MSVDLADSVTAAFARDLRVVEYGADAHLIDTPLAFEDGHTVTLCVEDRGPDMYVVTDRGLVTDELSMAGVDLDTNKSAARSWAAIKRALDVPPVVMGDTSEYELSGSATSETLGRTVMRIAEAAVRAEGLKAFAPPHRRRSFKERVINTAGDHGLTVVPNEIIPTRHGGERQVTCGVEGKRRVYVQALSSVAVMESYDHTRSVFGDASLPREQMVTAIQQDAKVRSWQIDTLNDISTVVGERELADFYEELRAA